MSIIRVIWRSRLQWNKYVKNLAKRDNLNDYTFGCDIIINTTQLSQFSYDEDYDFREKLMYQMSHNGISNKDISDYLNEHKIQPKRTEKYTTKLVWSILKKYRLKLERQKHVEVRYENIGLYKRLV